MSRCAKLPIFFHFPLLFGLVSQKSWPESQTKRSTPQKFNSEFTPEKWWLELEDDPFLLGETGTNFRGLNLLNFGRVYSDPSNLPTIIFSRGLPVRTVTCRVEYKKTRNPTHPCPATHQKTGENTRVGQKKKRTVGLWSLVIIRPGFNVCPPLQRH